MDQDAFRALLATSSNSNSSQKTSQHSRSLALGSGSTIKSTNKYNSNSSGSTYKPSTSSSLKPRKFVHNKESDGTSRNGYRDRASERRKGLDGDFAEAEHLLKDFEARVTAAGSQIDKDTLEQQTKYLGGDERHTILVKGLDHALLERRKAELSQGGKLGQVTDEDLETAYEQNAKPSSSTHPTTLSSTATTSSTNVKNKKNRDELLAQLKESRSQQPPDLVVVEKLKAVGKFKPIGFTSIDINPQESKHKEHKSRKGEKKKKKKAPKAEPSVTLEASVPKNELPADSEILAASKTQENLEKGESEPPKAEANELSNTSSKVTVLPATVAPPANSRQSKDTAQMKPDVEDLDFDIFGDAGEYKGLDEESSEEEEGDPKAKSSEGLASELHHAQGIKKRKTYFEDDEVESDTNSDKDKKEESLEASLKKPIESASRLNNEDAANSIIDDDQIDECNGIGILPRLTKLEGLSGSTDIKSLLAVDALQEKEEKRKAKKQKNNSNNKSGSDKILSDKDRLNRDYLQMQRFLEQKKNSKTSPSNPSNPNNT